MGSYIDNALQPTVSVRGNLRRLRNGAIWADYRVTGLAYGYTSDERKFDCLVHHKNLFKGLPDNSLLMGLVAAMDADQILARAMKRTDVSANRYWREECEGKHEYFSAVRRPTERVFVLSMPIVEPDTAGDLTGTRRSAERNHQEMSRAQAEAQRLAAKLPAVFDLVPLTAAQMVWIWNRAISRGAAPEAFPPSLASNVGSPTGAFGTAEFDEGHRRQEGARWRPSSYSPLVKVTQPGRVGSGESWQTLMAIESFPLDGLQFPGSEFFTIADRVEGYDIDWAMRIHKQSRDQAIASNTKKLKRLNEQLGERDSEISFAQNTLFAQRDMLDEYTSLLETNDDEVQVEICPVFAVAARSRQDCESAALKLSQEFDRARIKLVAALGGQRELFAAMNPGGANLRAVTDYSHPTISEYAAACVPFTTNDVGDTAGPVFAENLSGRRHAPVHLEWWREATKDASPSVAFAGELGAGKTWGINTLLFHLYDAGGGQSLCIDRTDQGEYAGPASTLPHHTIIDLMNPRWSMDPLRIFSSDIGVDKTVDLLTPLFGCTADSPMGLTLGELLDPQKYRVNSIPELLAVLQRGLDLGRTDDGRGLPPGWEDLARHLTYWAGRRYAAALMDPNLPPADLDATAIVIRTNRVEVPTQEEVNGRDPLTPTKVFGRAIYGLSTEIGRQAFGANKTRVGAVVIDEAYHVTSTPTGLASVSRIIRDGRKDNTALLLGSHDPVNDFPVETALDLIPIRIVMRHRDEGLARRSLAWLGIDPDANPHIVRDLTRNTSPKGPDGRVIPGREGEAYLRDARKAIGRIRILGPSSPTRRTAMSTTPPEQIYAA